MKLHRKSPLHSPLGALILFWSFSHHVLCLQARPWLNAPIQVLLVGFL